MDAHTRNASLHPALWIAAVSVTAFSVVGIAALTGAFERPAQAASLSPASPARPEAPALAVRDEPPAALPTASPEAPVTADLSAGKPAIKATAPRKAPAEPHDDTRQIRVAGKTYDPGIDVIPAPSAPAGDSAATRGADEGLEAPRAENGYHAPAPVCADCGIVESVREIEAPADPSGLGAAAGGVVGGLLGNKVGKGSGRTIATIIGIAGGAYAGHQIEKTQRRTTRHEVGVRLGNGQYRTITLDTEPLWHVGDKVKILNGALVPAD